jgi:RHS repeat-associated protein
MVLEGRSGVNGDSKARFKFTGKERDAETGYDYFGARYYDARIGRWLSVDPMAGKYPSLSGYQYSADSPIRFLDPNGKEIINQQDRHVSVKFESNGSLTFSKNADDMTKRVCNALNLSPDGREWLQRAVASKTKVGFFLSIGNESSTAGYREGWTDKPGDFVHLGKDGKYATSKVYSTILIGTLMAEINDENSTMYGLTLDQAIGAVAAHELVHGVDEEEVDRDAKYINDPKHNGALQYPGAEKKPNEIRGKIILYYRRSSGMKSEYDSSSGAPPQH